MYRCIVLLIQSENSNDFTSVLIDILMVLSREYNGTKRVHSLSKNAKYV